MLGVSANDKHCVTVDGKVVVGRRLHHPIDIELACTCASPTTHKARAALFGLSATVGSGMAAGAASRTLQSDLFDPNVT